MVQRLADVISSRARPASEAVLVDGDRFEETNLNRQLLATSTTIGLPKPLAARERLRQVNPGVEVIPVNQRRGIFTLGAPAPSAALLAAWQAAEALNLLLGRQEHQYGKGTR
ncbi:MAG: ThiF family adenylyltransferase [Bacillota bacterium]|nr:ThiF family adenylyltransferase [Bacillota bacterium]